MKQHLPLKLVERELRVDGARLSLVLDAAAGADDQLALELHWRVIERDQDRTERVVVGERVLWLKGGPLRGEPLFRHGLRAMVGEIPPPREREARVLCELERIGIPCARPLACGSLWRLGFPLYQWLATWEIAGATPLVLLDPDARAGALPRIVDDLARFHSHGYRHGDAHARNFLVRDDGATLWIDAWRYLPRDDRPLRARHAHEDLKMLLDDPALALGPDAQAQLRARYERTRRNASG